MFRSGGHPDIGEHNGLATFNSDESCIEWTLTRISSTDKTGSLEFSVPNNVYDVDEFFPVKVSFHTHSGSTYSGIEINDCNLVDSGEAVDFGLDVVVLTDEYTVV